MPAPWLTPLRLVAIALLTLAGTLGLGLSVPAANAISSNAGIYAVAPEWGGFCPDVRGLNNYATYVHYVNYTTGDRGGDSGDDIVWMRVRLGVNNSVQVNVQCRWSTPIGMSYNIVPSRNGQTYWFSIGGSTWRN